MALYYKSYENCKRVFKRALGNSLAMPPSVRTVQKQPPFQLTSFILPMHGAATIFGNSSSSCKGRALADFPKVYIGCTLTYNTIRTFRTECRALPVKAEILWHALALTFVLQKKDLQWGSCVLSFLLSNLCFGGK